MTIVFQCSRCGSSASSERQLAEICPCNMMDRTRPAPGLVIAGILTILAVVAPLIYISTLIPN